MSAIGKDTATRPKNVIAFDIRRYLTGGWYLPSALIVQQESDGKLAYIVQYATPDTIGSYGYSLTPLLSQLFGIIESLTEKALMEKFSPPKGKPKPVEELLQIKEVKEVMERYVHRQMDAFLKKMVEKRFPLTFMAEKKMLLEDVRVQYAAVDITPHLIFRRIKDGIKYRLNFSTGEERWLVRWKKVIPLTNKPGWLLVDHTLYPLPDLNGYLVKPFMQNDEITVPNHLLRSYFQKFILKTVEKTEIEAEGFDLTTTRKLEGCELQLSRHLFNDQVYVRLRFLYSGTSFTEDDSRQMRTALHFADESDIRILQVKRNMEGEQAYGDQLRKLGFERAENALWQLPEQSGPAAAGQREGKTSSELSQFQAMDWLSENIEKLHAAGFTVADLQLEERKVRILPLGYERQVVQGHDWFDVHIVLKAGDFEFPFSRLAPYIREDNRFFPLPDGSFFLIPAEWMAKFHGLAHLGKVAGEHIRLSKSQRPLLESLALQAGEEVMETPPAPAFTLPSLLKASLRPYQEEGARWLVQHYREGLGACLADDMGLGKTLQTLTALLFAKEQLSAEQRPAGSSPQASLFEDPDLTPLRALVLLPSSLVFNWEREIRKFASGITICRHTGPQRTKDARILARYDLVLTTYQTARQDLSLLRDIPWEYAVLDESQYIKNPQSAIFKAAGEIQARHRISLSGTPIENSLSDLWAQMQFLNPGMLGSYAYFKKHFIQPIEKRQDEQKKAELRSLVGPYLLRRTKEAVAPDLPPLTEQIFFVEMAAEQAKLYEREKSAVRNKLMKLGDPSLPQHRVAVLAALTRLRQIANHPALVATVGEAETEVTPAQEGNVATQSGKFADVLEYWENIRRAGHKALVFSSFEKYLQLFRSHFEAEGHPYAWLTGEVAAAQRQREVDRFNSEVEVQAFFMTTKAGGTGLNLTAADYVFLLDPWWNPFVESQAIARAHRIGQTEKVVAVKFIARDTIEEKILKMQERKSALADEFLSSPEKMVFTREGLESLLV
jgi:non-specific serine/threonine protein kinase